MGPQPNPDIYAVVKRYAYAWAANDMQTIMDCYHEKVVFHYFGESPLAGTHRGKAACVAILKQVQERTNRQLVTIKDVLAGEHFGLIVATEKFERDGSSIEIDRLLRYRVADGKLAECWVYDENQRLIDEYWSRQS